LITNIFGKIKAEVSAEYAMRQVEQICTFRREVYSPGYREAAKYCCAEMRKAGLDSVALLEYPADGETRYKDYVMPRVWEIEEAELKVIAPVDAPVLLARYSERWESVNSGSTGTNPRSGLEAEVVLIPDGTKEEDYEGVDVEGKIVFTHEIARYVKKWAVRKGAIGVITDVMRRFPPVREMGDYEDEVQWHFFWGHKDEEMCFAFAISPNQGRWLTELIEKTEQRGERVKVWAMVDAEMRDGVGEVPCGLIEGREKEDEILILGHLTEPGADDNASGDAVMLETARCLNKLIREGALPRPRRNIRFAFVYEFYGTAAYLANNPERTERTLLGLNVDNVGADQEKCGSSLIVTRTSEEAPTFGNDLLEKVLEMLTAEFTGLGITDVPLFRWGVASDAGGDSRTLREFGVPTPHVITWPDKFYHSSGDVIENIDPKMLERVSVLTAAYAYAAADAGPREARWLANEITTRAKERLGRKAQKFITEVFSGGVQEDPEKALKDARKALRALLKSEIGALRSLERLVDGAELEKLRGVLDAMESQLRGFVRTESRRMRLATEQ
jgi:hypothetical protein